MIPVRKRTLATMLGRANGNLIRNLLFPNKPGKFSAGLAKKPPKDGPKMEPRLHTRGIIENALGWSSFSGTISATIVRMIPTDGCQQTCYALVALETPTISVATTRKGSDGNCHWQACRHSPRNTAYHRTSQGNQNCWLSAKSIRRSTPNNCCHALWKGEDSWCNSSPLRDIFLVHPETFYHLWLSYDVSNC